MRGISQAFREFNLAAAEDADQGHPILLFLLMTLIVVFSFTWFGLYLARGITGPIEQLAEGTREVAAGTSRTRCRRAAATRSASSSSRSTA